MYIDYIISHKQRTTKDYSGESCLKTTALSVTYSFQVFKTFQFML